MGGGEAANGVKCIAAVDVILALISFISFMVGIFSQQSENSKSLVTLLVAKEGKLTGANAVALQNTVIIIISVSAGLVIVLRVLMDVMLFRAAVKMKDEPVVALAWFGRWRAWATIVIVLLLAGILTFYIAFGTGGPMWVAVFMILEVTFEAAVIIYVGAHATEIETEVLPPSQPVDLKILYQL